MVTVELFDYRSCYLDYRSIGFNCYWSQQGGCIISNVPIHLKILPLLQNNVYVYDIIDSFVIQLAVKSNWRYNVYKINIVRIFLPIIICFIWLNVNLLSQSLVPDQVLNAKDLPFREVIASFELEDGVIWMVLPSHICRNNWHSLDCFEITTQGVEAAFVVEGRYIILHTLARNNASYFDTFTSKSGEFPWHDELSLIYHHDINNSLLVTDYCNMYRFDFQNNALVFYAKDEVFKDVVPNIRYRLDSNNYFQVFRDHSLLNGRKIDLPFGANYEYVQGFSTPKGLLYSTGESIYLKPKGKDCFELIFSDDRFCKKLYVDQCDHVILNIHKNGICKYSEKMISLDFDALCHTDLSYLIPTFFDATVAHLGGNNFNESILLSSYQGFVHFSSSLPLFEKYFDIIKKGEFGRILRGICTDNSGNIWSAGEVRNIYQVNKLNSVDSFPINIAIQDSVLPLSFSRNLIFDEKNNCLWNISGSYVKNESILYSWDLTTKKVNFIMPIQQRIWSMIKQKDALILTNNRESVLSFDLKTFTLSQLFNFDRKFEPETRVLFSDADTLLIGGKGGLWRYNINTKHLEQFSALREAQIYAINKMGRQVLIGTLQGLWTYHLDTKQIKVYDTKSGLTNNYVTACFPVGSDRILVATYSGVNLIDTRYGLISKYDKLHGLSDNECNFISHHDDGSHYYIGTINGLNVVNHDRLNTHHTEQAHIYKQVESGFSFQREQFEVFSNKISFEPEVQKIVVYFECDTKDKKIKYAYKFNHGDTLWKPLDGHTLEILRSSQKKLSLDIKCTNSDGVWSDSHKTYQIQFLNYWYNEPLFYSFLVFVIGYIIYWKVNSDANKRKIEDEKLANAQRSALEHKLQALQSQMNPHFLFNAMASIQYMIHTKDIYKADNYLTSFGTLVRMILESSKNKTWSVRSEIKMLKLYLELEKERFEDGFIHTEIDTKKLINEDMEIPPMLIQPFVENACNHAFWGLKDKQAELKIIFSEKEDALIVKISDNGVGIEKSKSHSTISYKKSRGMEITQERIDNFNSNNLKQITLKISELYPLKEFPGTLITIIINK